MQTPEAVAWAGILLLVRVLDQGQAGLDELQEVLREAKVMDILVMGSGRCSLEGGGGLSTIDGGYGAARG